VSLRADAARSVKWNLVDKLATQVLYAVTGVVLAILLPKEDFGLVGAVLVFQSFASLFIESGFASALIQRKAPTQTDYSTVFWFNMAMAVALYALLWVCAPLIARWFQNDVRIIPLARAMFLTFILNAAAIVQANRMIKQMNPRPVAISNCLGLALGSIVGIYLALTRCDAWALVWQSVVAAGAKTAILWIIVRWKPDMAFSFAALRSFFRVGSGVMGQSMLNLIFQNIYSFFIGNRVGIAPLGVYTQADKWSKMGVTSFSQVLTSSFLPVLAEVQDDRQRLHRVMTKINRATAYALFACFGWLIAESTPLFHLMFASKWDDAILLFRLLLVRGVLTVLTSLAANYILAIGRARALMLSELLRDGVALAALVACLPLLGREDGMALMLYGQIAASAVAYVATLLIVRRVTGLGPMAVLLHNLPYLCLAVVAVSAGYFAAAALTLNPWLQCLVSLAVAAALYLGANALLGSQIQRELLSRFLRRRN
jgi:O-antigen/teichoic acid export membrane protein